jgi:hypothetical protein
MNLPGRVPPGLAAYLSLVRLERPVFSRSELLVLTLHEQRRFDRQLQRRNEAVFRSASENRITGRRGWSQSTLERVMNSIRNGIGMRETEIAKEPSRPWNPHSYAVFAQVHNTL